uniref:Ras-GAP domain-containing protein n=1 Tax=Peronospora matthiolae TaxID=2874970 RepID=A0AAV1U857_9STRA
MQARLLLVLLLLGRVMSQRSSRDLDIAHFLQERATWHPMCLYTFDTFAIREDSATIRNRVPNNACPFDALEPEGDLVTSLNTESASWQLGVHLAEDPANNTKRVQLSSTSTVSARDFFTMAAVRNDTVTNSGVTFEMVIRRRAIANRSMTLFSIANEYDSCVDPGFRLDLNEHQVLVFVYFLPVLEEGGEAGVEACYEQRLFSVDNSAACQLPPLQEPVDRTPPVQIIVTLDPSSERGMWKTDFYMSYTDVETDERVDCVVHDEQHPPNAQVLNQLVEGRYRLYVGNSPRNVVSPRQRRRLAPTRKLQPLGNTSHLNATERLRETLKQKLMRINGPRLPKAMRIFGDNSLSLNILGITFPPLNEDTPLAYLRSKLAEFKKQHGDQIVDYLVSLVHHKMKDPVVMQQSNPWSDQSRSKDSDGFSRAALFQGADSATFDVFHFAIYRRVVSEDQVNAIARQQLMPSRQFPSRQQTVRMSEDSTVLLNLTMLHGVYNDLQLEIRDLPEFGQLLLYVNRTTVTTSNKDAFRELPLEHQRHIFFQPLVDQNNENLPLPNPVAFSRRVMPYATVKFGIANSSAGRAVNKSLEATFDIFVDAVNDAPRPRSYTLDVQVEVGFPVSLHLEGDDSDGVPPPTASNADASQSHDLMTKFTFRNATASTPTSLQMLKIVRMPHSGVLYDCKALCGVSNLELNEGRQSVTPTRIYRNSTDIENATHSTHLMYIYRGWGQHEPLPNENASSVVVDELWYKLSDGEPGVFSAVAKVYFVLVNSTNYSGNPNVLAAVRVDEDSFRVVNLFTLDPLAAFISVQTRLRVTALPRHGALYQYSIQDNCNSSVSDTLVTSVGARISNPGDIISDLCGRVIYAPELDYFNIESNVALRRALDFDHFEYQVLNATSSSNTSLVVNERSPSAQFIDGSIVRRIEVGVVNVPDAIVVLPPFVFTPNASVGKPFATPITFRDPDSRNPDDLYQVNLEAVDSASEFELGFAITNDDLMIGCSFERPCTLRRSANGSLVNTSSRTMDELQFHISTQLYDPSHIQVIGTKSGLSKALSALSFRDLSGVSSSHAVEFMLWIKQAGNESRADTRESHTTFTVQFSTNDQVDSISSVDMAAMLKSTLRRYVFTLLFLIAGWLVLSNSSCNSIGFCCCCSRMRKKRRQKFEQQQRLFQAQVAQNDHEYSALLMGLADMLLVPNLRVSTCVLECCVESNVCQTKREIMTQAVVLRSLLPLLEAERQGTRFVFQLIAKEYRVMTSGSSLFQRHRFLRGHSTAGKALARFCRIVGTKWLSEVLGKSAHTATSHLNDTVVFSLDRLLDKLVVHIETLPAEIVILCRACAKLFQENESTESRELELDAMHLVFFNHFLGPALIFPRENELGLVPSLEQQTALQVIAHQVVAFADQWMTSTNMDNNLRSRSIRADSLPSTISSRTRSAAMCRYKYEALLDRVSQSTTVASTYDPNEKKADIDCELMGLCLMNIHSLMDSYYFAFKQRVLQTQASVVSKQTQRDTLNRVCRLLKALGQPLASIHEYVEYARAELMTDPLLWNGFSFQEWQERAQTSRSPCPLRSTCQLRDDPVLPSIVTMEQVMLEQGDSSLSPHDVDYLRTCSS